MVTVLITIFQKQKQNPFQLIRSSDFPTAWQNDKTIMRVEGFYQLIYYRGHSLL